MTAERFDVSRIKQFIGTRIRLELLQPKSNLIYIGTYPSNVSYIIQTEKVPLSAPTQNNPRISATHKYYIVVETIRTALNGFICILFITFYIYIVHTYIHTFIYVYVSLTMTIRYKLFWLSRRIATGAFYNTYIDIDTLKTRSPEPPQCII